MYAFAGSMKRDVSDDRSEVHCLRAILSEQDLETVTGASGRPGFRRTMPSLEKCPRPKSEALGFDSGSDSGSGVSDTGASHGESSSWRAIVSSILASPPESR